MDWKIFVSLTAVLFAAEHLAAAPVISEFLADPDPESSLFDEDGEAQDWIEIYNPDAASLDLEGYGLSDDAAFPLKWTFPARTLAPGGRILVFASGKDRAPAAGELHTNFGMDGAGEYLALAAPDGTVLSAFAPMFPPQREGISYGSAPSLAESRPIHLGIGCRYRVATGTTTGWQTLGYFDGGWSAGQLAVGFDVDGDYDSIIGAGSDTEAAMYDLRSSCYARIPFTVADPTLVRALVLRMKYDDGFDAFINGVKVASRYMEANPQWDSFSTENRIDALNDRYEVFDADAALGALVAGQNVLAIQACNFTANGLDFLIDPELYLYTDDGGEGFEGYFEKPTPSAPNNRAVLGFVKDTKFSVDRGYFTEPTEVAITTETPGATIRYTVNGNPPTAASGQLYTGPITVSSTQTIRAAAFKDGFRETNVDAQTYLFTSDIRTQSDMSAAITNNAAYSAQIEPGLRSLPAVALSLRNSDFFDANGIHSIATLEGRAQEVEVSFEFFDPEDGSMTQANGGIRIHGGNARTHPKKPLRLYFRSEYGPGRLGFPLFDGAPVQSFDQLILRPGGHDSWSLADVFGTSTFDLPAHGTIMRDQFLRRTENAIGILSPVGRYVNLFINGRYWGVYDLHERANATYFADHLGGAEDDFDVVHHPEFSNQDYVVTDGTADSWQDLVDRAAAGVTSPSAYAEVAEMLDIDSFIDHMIVRMWSGDYDWCGPIYRAGEDVTVFSNKNWYAGRRARGSSPDGFRLFTWDGEMSMGNHLMFNLAGVDVAQRVTDLDLTRANSAGSPVAIYDALRRNTEFKVRFGDRLQKHFFNGGAMTPAANAARWAAMEDEIEGAIIGESARWGDEGGITFTRDGNWRPEVAWVQNTFIAGRNATVINQFRAVGLYPPVDAPSFSQHGGEIPDDGSFSLAITGPAASTIYYTTDGSDPYDPPLSISTQLIGEDAPVTALVPTTANGGSALGSRWYFLGEPSNSANWKSGTNGVGYETAPADYADLINTDVSEMYTSNGSVYIRILFEIPDQETLDAFDKLTLSMRYDDGFAAYLNTRLVANKNAPLTPAYNSVATANHPDSDAVIYESFDISSNLFALRVGSNILAIQGMNDGTDSSDLLIQARLEASADISPGGPSANAVEYTGAIPLAQSGAVRARALSQDGDWSALTEAQFIYGTPASAANLVVSELSYRPLGATTLAEIASGATDRGAFEFIEVMNVSAERIDLTGVAFSAGIVFDFTGSNATSLDPGGRALVVANLAAFTARYGAAAAALVAGEFGDLTNLDNGGELVALNAADGSAIQSFTYDDRAPWPESPDGEGFSLVLIDPMSLPDHGDPASWRASLDLGGTPGGDSLADYESWARRYFDPDSPSFAARSAPGNDDDGDGIVNLWEKILATNPTVPNSSGIAGGVIEDAGESFLMIEATVRAGASANLFGEGSENLAQWSDADATLVDIVPRPSAATETVRYRLIAPMESGGGFLRFGASE